MTLIVPQRKELVLVTSDRVRDEILRVQQLPVLTVDAWLEDVLKEPTSTTIVVPAKTPTPRALRSPITQPGYNLGRPNRNKGKRFPATPPTPAEALRVLDITGQGKVGIRNRALLATLWRSALRISEACDLLPWHINFDESSVFVACGKGGKTRTVGIDAGALKEISRWLMVRATLPIHDPDQQPLFCTVCLPDPGNRLNPAYVRHTLARLGKAIRCGTFARCAARADHRHRGRGMSDERTISGDNRVCGYLGPWSSTMTLAWLASHRNRLRTLILGGKRLSVLVIWDTAGTAPAGRSEADVDAIRQLVNGEPTR